MPVTIQYLELSGENNKSLFSSLLVGIVTCRFAAEQNSNQGNSEGRGLIAEMPMVPGVFQTFLGLTSQWA